MFGFCKDQRVGSSTPRVAAACIIPILVVIGIVAAVALPAYQDYAKRAAAQKAR